MPTEKFVVCICELYLAVAGAAFHRIKVHFKDTIVKPLRGRIIVGNCRGDGLLWFNGY